MLAEAYFSRNIPIVVMTAAALFGSPLQQVFIFAEGRKE